MRMSTTAVAFLIAVLAVPASAQYDAFIRIPGVKGYSAHVSHQGWSDLDAHQIAVAPPLLEKGKEFTNRCVASLAGRLGPALPAVLQLVGAPLAGEVVIEKVHLSTNIVVARTTFFGAEIASIQVNEGEPTPTESISMSFGTIKAEYKEQKANGTVGETVTGTYDCTQVK